jgi:hypothetical protein
MRPNALGKRLYSTETFVGNLDLTTGTAVTSIGCTAIKTPLLNDLDLPIFQ